MLVGVDASQYSVRIGQESCNNIDVTMHSITCLPPKSEPSDPLHKNTRVQVRIEHEKIIVLRPPKQVPISFIYIVRFPFIYNEIFFSTPGHSDFNLITPFFVLGDVLLPWGTRMLSPGQGGTRIFPLGQWGPEKIGDRPSQTHDPPS